MEDIPYKDVNKILLDDIPEVRDDYDAERKHWEPDDVNAHVVYGSVFPKLIHRTSQRWIKSGEDDYLSLLKRCFQHVELLASSSDFETRCVIEASLLETLIGENGDWSPYQQFFGPSTKKLAEDVKVRFAG